MSCRCASSGVRIGRSDDLGHSHAGDAVLAGNGFVTLAEPDDDADPGIPFGVRSWHTPPEGQAHGTYVTSVTGVGGVYGKAGRVLRQSAHRGEPFWP